MRKEYQQQARVRLGALPCGLFRALLASLNRRPENVVIHPVVISELKFRDVQREIFSADLVEAAHDAALQERPKTINGLRVNGSANVLFFGMANDAMRERFPQLPVAGMLIGWLSS